MIARLSQLASLIGGTLRGADITVSGAAVLTEASPDQLTMIDQAEKVSRLINSQAAAAIVPMGTAPLAVPTIEVAGVHDAFTLLIHHFRPARRRDRTGINTAAHISPTARIGENVQIDAGVTIGDDVEIGAGCTIHAGTQILSGCRIGAECTLYPNVSLYEDTVLGPRCIIHSGAVLGAFGFGYKMADGQHQLAPQLGRVELGADVEIGANSTIDRGTYGATLIGDGTKVDNQVQIAHNCRIGRHNLLCAQVGIAGSTTTGDYVVMAGQVGVRDHVHIGAGAVLGAMSGITNDVPQGTRMIGIPATPEREQKLKLAALSRLPEMRKELKALTATVHRLEDAVKAISAAELPVADSIGNDRAHNEAA